MTNRQWLDAGEDTDPADADAAADRIERSAGIADPTEMDARGLVTTFVRGLVLPLCLVGAALVVLMWFVIRNFHLLG